MTATRFRRGEIWIFTLTILQWVYRSVDFIGNYQTAKQMIEHAPEYTKFVVQILLWPGTGPVILGAVLTANALWRRRAEKEDENPLVDALLEIQNLEMDGQRMIEAFDSLREPLPTPGEVEQWEFSVQRAIKSKAFSSYLGPDALTNWRLYSDPDSSRFFAAYQIRYQKYPPNPVAQAYEMLSDRAPKLRQLVNRIESRPVKV